MMRAPDFWWREPERPGLLSRLLSPASAIWRAVTRHRLARPGVDAGVPVICVGNLTAGGAGKTPVVAWIARRLGEAGHAPHIISRGHGGSIEGPHRVDPERDGAAEVGDEPMLLSAWAPVWTGRDRAASARAAVADGAEVLVMDDGFQNPDLVKHLSLVVVDAGQGFGNGRVIPAGPLREPVTDGLARAEGIVLIGDPGPRAEARRRWPELNALPLFEARIVPLKTGLNFEGLRAVAFAGIGRPEKVFETLRGLGADLVETIAFADHYAYPDAVLKRLKATADRTGAMLVTTEKDAVRLPPAFRREVMTVPVTLEPEDPEALQTFLTSALT